MRIEGWEQLLEDHIKAAYGKPFAWGSHDCALWAGAWIRKCTGRDFISGWEGRYKSERGAKGLLRKRGYRDLEHLADEHSTSIPVMLAKRGDILLHPSDGCLGIAFGRHGFFLTLTGVTLIDTLSCPKSWVV